MKERIGGVSLYAAATLFVAITFVPFYLLLITSLKTEAQYIHQFWLPTFPLHFENYGDAFERIYEPIMNSLVISVGIIVLVLINSICAGYCFSRFKFFGKRLLFSLILMLFMVSPFLLLIPQFILFRDFHLINTYAAQILAPMAGASALATLLMKSFFDGISKSLLEAAEVEGAGEYRILLQIVIPLSLPVISTVAIIEALLGWNNYIWPLVATTGDKVEPVILAVGRIIGPQDRLQGIKFAGYIISSIPLILLFIFATKPFVEGVTSGAVKG